MKRFRDGSSEIMRGGEGRFIGVKSLREEMLGRINGLPHGDSAKWPTSS